MKTIRFIVSALAAIALGLASVSCEGLLKTDSKIVMFESENTLDQSVDTVYSVLGIIQKMQVIDPFHEIFRTDNKTKKGDMQK